MTYSSQPRRVPQTVDIARKRLESGTPFQKEMSGGNDWVEITARNDSDMRNVP